MAILQKSPIAFRLILLAFCIVWFYALGARTLVPTDEGRYAEIAREMAVSGDWITPRLNGIKYFSKPPLQMWINALTFRLFGLGEWQARLWTGLCGLFGIVLTAYAGQRVFNRRVGLFAGVVLASSFAWAAMSHFNTLDMSLSGMMTLALCALLIAQRDGASTGEQKRWMLACWVGMALALMSKGLAGIVLPGAVMVLYTVISRDWTIWKRLHFWPGLLIFFLIAAPWFVLVTLRNPEFPQSFFIYEHFQRFTSEVHRREGAWHYFIPILLGGILPWLGVLGQSLWSGWRNAPPARFQPRKMLLAWAGFIFLFFSFSGSKLPSYILPIFPALALLIACYLEQASPKALMFTASLMALAGAAGLALSPRILTLAKSAYEIPLYQSYKPWAVSASAVMLAGSLFAILLARRRNEQGIVVLGFAAFLAGQALMLGYGRFGLHAAGLQALPAIQAELTPEVPIYAVGRYEYVLPFYLGRTLTLVKYENKTGLDLPQAWQAPIPDTDSFLATWRTDHAAGRKSIAILRPDIFDMFERQAVPMRVIARDPRRVIVVNRPGAAASP